MSASPSVNGIENQRTVCLLPHCGAGTCSGSKSGNHFSPFHQRIQGAYGILHIVPRRIRRFSGQGNGGAYGNVSQGIHIIAVGLQVDGQYHLIFAYRCGGCLIQHLLHCQVQRISDGQFSIRNAADHIHTGLCGAIGMGSIEIMGIEVNAAVGHTGLVDRRDLANQLRVVAKTIIHAIT